MKQTAVEYLLDFCNSANCRIPNDIIQEAKEIEKEQIINAYTSNSMIRTNSKAEQYFNETFNTKER